MLIQNFVTFLSAGTFFSEATTEKIESWDVDKAVEMSKNIVERYNSRPYGFYFSTNGRAEDELDSKETKRSAMYYINGVVKTLEEIEAKNDRGDRILISNMKNNGYNKVVTMCNPWEVTQPFKPNDKIVKV